MLVSDPRKVHYDPFSDTVTVDGIKYSGELFRFFSEAAKTGQLFRFVERGKFETVTIQTVDEKELRMSEQNVPTPEEGGPGFVPAEPEQPEQPIQPTQPEQPAQPEAPVVATRLVRIIVRRAHLRVIKSYNNAKPKPKPIMKIYPRDGSAVSERVWFNAGSVINVLAVPVQGDSNSRWWEVYDPKHLLPHPEAYQRTFLRVDNCVKV